MENTIEIQKEFEILVSELERLKSINELTSSNAESAKQVVFEIDKLANATQQIHSSVELDFLQKNEKINELLAQLAETISQIDKTTQSNQVETQKKVDELISKSDLLIENNKESIIFGLDKIKDSLIESKDAINSKLEVLFSNGITSQNDSLNNYIQEINELHKKSTSTFLNSSNRFVNLIEELSTNVEKNNIFIKDKIDKLITNVENNNITFKDEFQQINKQISSLIADNKKTTVDLNKTIIDKYNELNVQIVQNHKSNKRNGIIMIASAIVTFGLLMAILFK